MATPCYRRLLQHPARFIWRVIRGFFANQGILLAGSVAYHALLSIIPLFTLLLIGLSHLVEQDRLLRTLAEYLDLLVPGQSHALVEHVAVLIAHRQVVGWLTTLALLMFSSAAFTILENAMSVIFFHRVAVQRRHFLTSALLPYLFIVLLGLGLLLVTVMSGLLQGLKPADIELFGRHWSLEGLAGVLLYLVGILGQIFILTAIYMVMPVGRLSLRHALIGGVAATVLWEGTRHFLVWYLSTVAFLHVVYGYLTVTIIALISLEVAAAILLLGAQVIAEYERLCHGEHWGYGEYGLHTSG